MVGVPSRVPAHVAFRTFLAILAFSGPALFGCDRGAQSESPGDEAAPSSSAPIAPTAGAQVVPTGAGGAAPAVGGPALPERVYTDDSMECVVAEPKPQFVQSGGYDHVVLVTNECDAVVQCEVSTDIDPAWIVVRIEASASIEVRTRVSAEDDEYEPRLECRYHD